MERINDSTIIVILLISTILTVGVILCMNTPQMSAVWVIGSVCVSCLIVVVWALVGSYSSTETVPVSSGRKKASKMDKGRKPRRSLGERIGSFRRKPKAEPPIPAVQGGKRLIDMADDTRPIPPKETGPVPPPGSQKDDETQVREVFPSINDEEPELSRDEVARIAAAPADEEEQQTTAAPGPFRG